MDEERPSLPKHEPSPAGRARGNVLLSFGRLKSMLRDHGSKAYPAFLHFPPQG